MPFYKIKQNNNYIGLSNILPHITFKSPITDIFEDKVSYIAWW